MVTNKLESVVDEDVNLPGVLVDEDVNLPGVLVDEDVNHPVVRVDEDVNLPTFLLNHYYNNCIPNLYNFLLALL